MFTQCTAPDGIIGNLLYFVSSHELSILFAALGGLISFLAPCVLPLIPGAIAYISGTKEGEKISNKKRLKHTLALTLGFLFAFVLIGFLFSVLLNNIDPIYGVFVRKIGAVIIIIFSLVSLGIIPINFVNGFSPKFIKGPKNLLKSFLFGIIFGLGWSPCATPILGTILGLSVNNPAGAIPLFIFYGLGLAVPFVLITFLGSKMVTSLISKSQKFYNIFSSILFFILLFVGVILLFS